MRCRKILKLSNLTIGQALKYEVHAIFDAGLSEHRESNLLRLKSVCKVDPNLRTLLRARSESHKRQRRSIVYI